MTKHHTIYFVLLLATNVAFAQNYNETYYVDNSFPWPYAKQFTAWWPQSWWAEQLTKVTEDTCNTTFNDYTAAFDAGPNTIFGKKLYSICYAHSACLLNNLSGDIIANYQSASVILGLTPSMLSILSPSLAEVALLSQHRPLLSLLISIGAPAMWPSRPAVFINPAGILLADTSIDKNNWLHGMLLKHRGRVYGAWLSITEYVLILAAVANVIEVSWEIGFRTISSFRCTAQYFIFLWVMLAMAVHGMTVLAVALRTRLPTADHMNLHHRQQSGAGQVIALQTVTASKPDDSAGLLSLAIPSVAVGSPMNRRIFLQWRNEFIPCILHTHCRCLDEKSQSKFLATGFNLAAGACSNIHFIVGVIIFSSLQFVSVWEVCNKILWRFVVSGIVCRFVMIIEVTAIRKHTRLRDF